jgi:DNA-binding CsgD family transcriptional regulator
MIGGLDPDIGQLFIERYEDNPWSKAAMIGPRCGAFDLHSLADRRLVAASEFYADVLKPQDTETMTGLMLPLPAGFDTGGVSIAFDGRDDSAPRASIELLNALAPYLRRAMNASLQLQASDARAQGLAEPLNAMPSAVLLVAQDAQVVFANARAERILADNDGLRTVGDRLAAARPADSAALQRMIGDAGRAAQGIIARGPDSLAIARPSGKPALSVLATPIGELRPRLALQRRPVALLIVTDAQEQVDIPPRAIDRLHALFGMTPTESRVAVLVAQGLSGPEAAGRLGIAAGTVHAHLKSVFAKTGVRRQSGLARLLTRTGAIDLH